MVELARQPPTLDNLMNEGIAFAIDRFQVSLPDCPIGRRPVMIGRTTTETGEPIAVSYNNLVLVYDIMGRLDRVMKVLETMRHIAIVNVH